jgi:nitrous oxide reductase accessory protein NosL
MKYFLILFLVFTLPLAADKQTILAQKGAKIAKVMCETDKLNALSVKTPDEAKTAITKNKICPKLTPKQLDAVAAYLLTKNNQPQTTLKINVPKDAKCPICGMFVAKYPKWVAYMKDHHGHDLYFDGVKDMMKYYFNNPKEKFTTILVSDFYTLKPLEAQKAYFVIGSNVYGPMGEELIPFKTKEDAEVFMQEHYGKKIIRFDEIKEDYLY